MFAIVKIRDRVRVDPRNLGKPMLEALKDSIRQAYNLRIDDRNKIQFLELISIDSISNKLILPNDGAVYIDAEFTYLVYKPILGEVTEGIVNTIIEKGAFVNLGYFDGFIHKSQVMDDFIEYNPNNKTFVGKNSKRVLKVGDKVKVRVVSISVGFKEGEEMFQIGLTMRQTGLGSYSWEEKKK